MMTQCVKQNPILYVALWVSLTACGDSVLERVNTFNPNTAPKVVKIQVNDSAQKAFLTFSGDQKTYSTDTQLEPGQVYYFTTEIEEKEEDLVTFSYKAESYLNNDLNNPCGGDISNQTPNGTNLGSFNNQKQSTDFRLNVTATTTYNLPDKTQLPLNSDIYVTITIKDEKEATTNYTKCLGPIKRKPVMTEVTYTGGDSSTLTWKADSSGNYIIIKKIIPCATTSAIAYPYTKGQVINRTSPFEVAPFCLILYDSMAQFDFIEH